MEYVGDLYKVYYSWIKDEEEFLVWDEIGLFEKIENKEQMFFLGDICYIVSYWYKSVGCF